MGGAGATLTPILPGRGDVAAWIVYRSSATAPLTAEALLDIVRSAERNNAAEGVSGMLSYDAGGAFAQLLEGPARAVRSRFDVIAADPRHAVGWWRSGLQQGPALTAGLPMGYIDLDVEYRGETQAIREAGPDNAQALVQRLGLLARRKYPDATARPMSQP